MRGRQYRLNLIGISHRHRSMHLVTTSGQAFEHIAGLLFIFRLAENNTVNADGSIRSDDGQQGLTITQQRLSAHQRLLMCQAHHIVFRRLTGTQGLVHVGRQNNAVQTQLLQNLFAPGRLGCQINSVCHDAYGVSVEVT